MTIVTNLIHCIKIISGDKIYNFTDNDFDIEFLDEIYCSSCCIKVDNIKFSNEIGEDSFQFSLKPRDNYFNDIFMHNLKHFNIEAEIFIIDRDELCNEVKAHKKGIVNKVKYENNNYVFYASSIGFKTKSYIGNVYSSSCRAVFAVAECGVDVSKFSYYGKISKIIDRNSFFDELLEEADNYFSNGIIKFISGKFKNSTLRVVDNKEKNVILENSKDIYFSEGDQYILIANCDKSLNSCKHKFANILNFRGEPFIPNKNKLVALNY